MGKMLSIPFFSQWDVDGNLRRTDCLLACLKMWLAAYLKVVIPINSLVMQTAEANSDNGLPPGAALPVLKAYGLEGVVRDLGGKDDVMREIDAGRSIIALITYGYIPERMDKNDVWGGHFVAVVGYDEKYVYLNDPDFWGGQRNRGWRLRTTWAEFNVAVQRSPMPNKCLFLKEVPVLENGLDAWLIDSQLYADNVIVVVHVQQPDAAQPPPVEYSFDFGDYRKRVKVLPPVSDGTAITTEAVWLHRAANAQPSSRIILIAGNQGVHLTGKKENGFVEVDRPQQGWISADYVR